MKKIDEQEMREAIHSIAETIQNEQESTHGDWVTKTLEDYHYLDITNPEQFQLLLSQAVNPQINILSRLALKDIHVERTKKYRIEFVYRSYQFMVTHLKSLILEYEGHGSSTDKTRGLLNKYLTFLMEDKEPCFNAKRSFQPKAGTALQWIQWIDTFYDLYAGKPDAYMEKRAVLLSVYDDYLKMAGPFYQDAYTNHIHFVSQEEVDGNQHYVFIDENEHVELRIQLKPNMNIAYNLLLGPERKRATYGTERPDWVNELLAITYEPSTP